MKNVHNLTPKEWRVQLKTWQKTWIDIFPKKTSDDQQTHEKMLNITDHQGNTNQTRVRYHLTSVRMAKINSIKNPGVSARIWRKGNPLTLVEMQTGAATLENSMEVSTNLKIELPYDPATAPLGFCPQNTKTLIQRNTGTPMFVFIATLSTIAKLRKEPKCSSNDEWIKKVWYICNGILLSHQKEWNLDIWNDVDTTRVRFAKWNKSDRERQIPYNFTHMCDLRNKTSKGKKNKRDKLRNRLLIIDKKLMVNLRGYGWGNGRNRWWGLRMALVMGTGCWIIILYTWN